MQKQNYGVSHNPSVMLVMSARFMLLWTAASFSAGPLMCAFHVLRSSLYFSLRTAAEEEDDDEEEEEEEDGCLSCACRSCRVSPAGGAQSAAEAALVRLDGAEKSGEVEAPQRRDSRATEDAPARARFYYIYRMMKSLMKTTLMKKKMMMMKASARL